MSRIAVSAAQGMGKTTFINDFIETFPNFKSSGDSYRKLIKKKKLSINKNGNQESQEQILNAITDNIMKYKKEDNVIHDRCPLDNLVYTLWLKAYGLGNITDDFVAKTIAIVKNSMAFLDVIFYIPILEGYPIPYMDEKETRERDEVYRIEIDNFFKEIQRTYVANVPVFFPFDTSDGAPAFIEIFGTREQRIMMSKLYFNDKGELYGEKDSLLVVPDNSQAFDPDVIKLQNEVSSKIITAK